MCSDATSASSTSSCIFSSFSSRVGVKKPGFFA